MIKTTKQKLDKYLTITMVFLFITPIIAYLYVSLMALYLSCSIQDVLLSNSNITIMFILAMINPYIGYLVSLMKKKLETKDNEFIVINMFFLLVSQLLSFNVFYFAMLLFVFYKIIKVYKINVKEQLQNLKLKQMFNVGGGSILVSILSAICLIATIRIM